MKIESNMGSAIPIVYEVGGIVRYTWYEKDLINNPDKKPIPNKFFKIKKVDKQWGVVDHGTDTVGVAYIRKTTFVEKIKFMTDELFKDN